MQNEMLELFQVEELEKRYEMGWLKGGQVSVSANSDGEVEVESVIKF
jgi:hypothetical protein